MILHKTADHNQYLLSGSPAPITGLMRGQLPSILCVYVLCDFIRWCWHGDSGGAEEEDNDIRWSNGDHDTKKET